MTPSRQIVGSVSTARSIEARAAWRNYRIQARWGEAVKAIVVLKPEAQLDLAELQQYLRGRIGGYKIPRSLEILGALPRNASGKVLRRLLRDQLASGNS